MWFILSPSARTGPSRLGPAGEGRSDRGVLHLHPRGQARYPEGGRRREDEPPGEGWRVRADAGDDGHQGDEHLESGPGGGSRPRAPLYGSGRPAFSPLTVLRGRGGIFPAPARGNPAPCDRRAISVQLTPATSGLSRSLADTTTRRSGHVKGRSRTDSQADSSRYGPGQRSVTPNSREPAGEHWYLLTRLLTRLVGTGETERDADDACQAAPQVSETRRDAGDAQDVRRMAHNPEVAGSNPAPATKARGRLSNREAAFCL
jgi:hypothetical protein